MAHVTGRRGGETRTTRELLDTALAYDPKVDEGERVTGIARACRRLNVISMRELITVALEKGQLPTPWEFEVLALGYNEFRRQVGRMIPDV